MSVKRRLGLSIGSLGLAWALASLGAAAPWDKLLTMRRIDADPDKTYSLTEENGPWMILACSFSGDNAQQQANELVLEIRQRYKLPAYVYRKKFDFGDEELARYNANMGNGRKLKYRRGSSVEEIAVMVGDYQQVDDQDAKKTLQELKFAQPECLKPKDGKSTSMSLSMWRSLQNEAFHILGTEKQKQGPMNHAFITTNPLLPKNYFGSRGLDNFVVKLNEDNPYSLLKCKGKYTVQVAIFHGRVTIDQSKIRELEKGGGDVSDSALAEAGEKAEKLAEALRLKGYDAYAFHDRGASIVTVGSFESAGTPTANGQTEINPQIYQIMKTFGAEPTGTAGGAMKPKSLVGIPFDIQPIPVQVPKRSISSDYGHSLVGTD